MIAPAPPAIVAIVISEVRGAEEERTPVIVTEMVPKGSMTHSHVRMSHFRLNNAETTNMRLDGGSRMEGCGKQSSRNGPQCQSTNA